MRNKMLLILIILALVGLFSCGKTDGDKDSEILPGDPVPEFGLQTVDGEMISSLSLKGNDLVVVFFNTWCPDCHEWLPVIQQWMDEDTNETAFLCIARGQDDDEIRPFWEENGYTMKVAPDPDKEVYTLFTGGKGYGVPLAYVIDKYGIVIKRILQKMELLKD